MRVVLLTDHIMRWKGNGDIHRFLENGDAARLDKFGGRSARRVLVREDFFAPSQALADLPPI